MSRYLLLGLALLTSPAGAQIALTQAAAVNDLTLDLSYFGIGAESRCGTEWLVVERRIWKCVRREPSGSLTVTEFGKLPPAADFAKLVRRATANDRRILFADSLTTAGPRIYSLDPVTLEWVDLGILPGAGWIDTPVLLVDANGDGFDEIVMRGFSADPDYIATLPLSPTMPSQLVRTLPFIPNISGQFDNDPNDELMTAGSGGQPGPMKFYDAQTLQLEPITVPGDYLGGGVVADWDGDGLDEFSTFGWDGADFLIDPNDIVQSRSIPGFGVPFSLIDYQGTNSRDLLLYRPDRVMIIDPVTTAVLLDFVPPLGMDFLFQPIAFAIDWNADGAGDLAWINNNRLWVFRNGHGISLQQTPASDKSPVGFVNPAAPELVTVESFYTSGLNTQARTRNPVTLALQSDDPLGPISDGGESCRPGELHPSPGPERLCLQNNELRLYSSSGNLLWVRANEEPGFSRFSFPVMSDATCAGEQCQRILVRDVPISTPIPFQTLRIFDSTNGQQLWQQLLSSRPEPLLALTDLTGDGVCEVVHSEFANQQRRLTALDGATHTQLWQSSVSSVALTLKRTDDSARRLALLEYDGHLSYLEPMTGQRLRTIDLLPDAADTCEYCSIEYLRQGDSVGAWVVGVSSAFELMTVARDLRGPIWRDRRDGRGVIKALSPASVYLGEHTALYRLQADTDQVFADELEGW